MKIETTLERASRIRRDIWTILQFLFIEKLKFQLLKLPIYRLKYDFSCKFFKNSLIKAWQMASHMWRGSSPLGECHLKKVACSPSFKYSSFGGGQVAKEARRRSSYATPIWSSIWCLLGVIFPRWHLLRDFFQRWLSTFSYGFQGPKFYTTWPKIQGQK